MEFFKQLSHKTLMLVIFTAMPVLVLVVFSWILDAISQGVALDVDITGLLLLLGATFMSGVFNRQLMNAGRIGDDGLTLFLILIVAYLIFAYVTYRDLHLEEGLFSPYLAQPLTEACDPFVFAIPVVGLLGTIFYQYFSLGRD